MLPVIPKEQFEELLSKPIKEAVSNPFNFEDFKRFVSELNPSKQNKDKILKYMGKHKKKGIKLIGNGSSRVAFFIEAGTISKDREAPCCLKIAKNKRGIAQNAVEIDLFSKHRLPCFPEMFYHDEKSMFIVTEVGTVCWWAFMENYNHDWNKGVNSAKLDVEDSGIIRKSMRIHHRNFSEDEPVPQLMDWLNPENSDARLGLSQEAYELAIRDIVKPLAKKNPKFQTIEGLLEYGYNGGWDDTKIEDLYSEENWGIVMRDGLSVPIPIDWGFNDEVWEKYYKPH